MIGCDVVAISRVAAVLDAHGERFLTRILTPGERAQRVWQADALARRWAVKEAVAKALGCGIGMRLSFQDIEVCHDAAGAPLLCVKGYETVRFQVSVSDDKVADVAMAVVVRL